VSAGKVNVVPGDVVIFTTTSATRGQSRGARGGQEPRSSNMTYVDKSAGGEGTKIEFSADNGKSYGAPETLMITDAQGKTRRRWPRTIPTSRWLVTKPLAPGGKGAFVQGKGEITQATTIPSPGRARVTFDHTTRYPRRPDHVNTERRLMPSTDREGTEACYQYYNIKNDLNRGVTEQKKQLYGFRGAPHRGACGSVAGRGAAATAACTAIGNTGPSITRWRGGADQLTTGPSGTFTVGNRST